MKFNIKHFLVASCALTASSYAFADVIIEVPQEISVLSVNESKVKLEGSLFSDTRKLTLPNGENQIVFRYEVAFEDRDDRQFVESDVVIASFNASDIELHFELPEYRNLHKAEQNIENFEWKLLDESEKSIVVREDKLLKDGMQIGRNYIRESAEYNKKNRGAAVWANSSAQVSDSTVVTVTNPTTGEQTSTATPTSTTAEEMLFFWYAKADEQTKQKFKEFVNKQ